MSGCDEWLSLAGGHEVKIMRPMGALGIAASAALVLAACGTDPASTGNTQLSGAATAPTATANVECGGKSPLTGEGSTAQKTAVDIFAQQYTKACPGQIVNYNATGS